MVCAACGKESSNRRVCPYCFTPYPTDALPGRPSTGAVRPAPAPASWGALEPVRAFVMRQSPIVRWSGLGIVVVGALWLATGGDGARAADVPPVVPSGIAATPMQREEALAVIRRTRETSLVEMQEDEVFVSYSAATWPASPEGQLALVLEFARADEIVEGKKRRIQFHAPDGRVFARADGVSGVRLVR